MPWHIFVLVVVVMVVLLALIYLLGRNRSPTRARGSPASALSAQMGDSFQPCPCRDGLICDAGVCKEPPGGTCAVSSVCPKGSVCYLGRCTPAEKGPEVSEGKLCVRHHAMVLDGADFVFSPRLAGVSHVVDLEEEGEDLYILTLADVGRKEPWTVLYRVRGDDALREEIYCPPTSKKIFWYGGRLNTLSADGRIYLVGEGMGYRALIDIQGWNITHTHVLDVIVGEDEITLVIAQEGGTKSWTWNGVLWNERGPSNGRVCIFPNHVEVIAPDESSIPVPGRYIWAGFPPHSEDSIYTLDETGEIREYYYRAPHAHRVVPVHGTKIKRTKQNLWLITSDRCYSV